MSKSATIDAKTIRTHLTKRYPADEWCLAFEVQNLGGSLSRVRFADAIAMHRWSSRGYRIHGFEIKVSRQDWVKELQVPEKAAAFSASGHVDHWWVIAPKGVVLHSELPPDWGFMKASAKTLRIEVDANRLIKHTAPAMQRTMKRGFAVALMRKLDPHDPITTEEVDRLVAARSTAIQLEHDRQLDDVRRKVQRHLEFAARFEQVFGKSLDEWWKSAEVSALQLQRAIHLLSLSEYDRLETIEMTGEEIAKRARELQSLVPSVKNWNGAAEEEARRLAQLNAMPEEGESSNGR